MMVVTWQPGCHWESRQLKCDKCYIMKYYVVIIRNKLDMHTTTWMHFILTVALVVKKKPTFQCRRHKRLAYRPWAGKIPWRREWQHITVFLPGKFHKQRRLTGYSPACGHGVAESDTTEHTAHIADIQYYNSFSCTAQWFNIILYLNLLQNKGYLSPLLYPFICWWTLRLFPCLGYCK